VSDPVCDREFVATFDGEAQRVVAEWAKPVRDRGSWRCDYAIHWLHRDEMRGYAVGIDSTQAMLPAMAQAAARIEVESPDADWLESGGLGLPETPAAR
jgi:hypothetical protein